MYIHWCSRRISIFGWISRIFQLFDLFKYSNSGIYGFLEYLGEYPWMNSQSSNTNACLERNHFTTVRSSGNSKSVNILQNFSFQKLQPSLCGAVLHPQNVSLGISVEARIGEDSDGEFHTARENLDAGEPVKINAENSCKDRRSKSRIRSATITSNVHSSDGSEPASRVRLKSRCAWRSKSEARLERSTTRIKTSFVWQQRVLLSQFHVSSLWVSTVNILLKRYKRISDPLQQTYFQNWSGSICEMNRNIPVMEPHVAIKYMLKQVFPNFLRPVMHGPCTWLHHNTQSKWLHRCTMLAP